MFIFNASFTPPLQENSLQISWISVKTGKTEVFLKQLLTGRAYTMDVNNSRVMLALMNRFYPMDIKMDNTDMIVHKTPTPLFCCKSMLLGYLLRHKVQIYAISKQSHSLLCVGPGGNYSKFSAVTCPVIYSTGKPVGMSVMTLTSS